MKKSVNAALKKLKLKAVVLTSVWPHRSQQMSKTRSKMHPAARFGERLLGVHHRVCVRTLVAATLVHH